MSALGTPVQDDLQPQAQDHQLQIQQQQLADGLQQQQLHNGDGQGQVSESGRKPKAPSVRRACAACHAGKTRCSESLPCQSCVKRGLAATCAYPDPDAEGNSQTPSASQVPFAPPQMNYAPPMHSLGQPNYYDYNHNQPFPPPPPPPPATNTTPTPTAATTTVIPPPFRPNKRARNLTDEEAAAITRNFTRGAFFIGRSEPIHIDPRLPVRLTLAEGDQVHFLIGDGVAPSM